MRKFLLMAVILSISLACFMGCSNLKERTETRIVKEVISFVEEREESDGVSVAKVAFRASAAAELSGIFDEKATYYTEQSFREQKNALFYCEMAVYIYESQPSLINDIVYTADDIGEEQGKLYICLTNADGVLTMAARYDVKDESTFVHLIVNYDEETEAFESYSVSEKNSFDGKSVYFENSYETREDGEELLYSAQYEPNDYYIFQSAAEDTVLAEGGDEEEVIATIHGEKSVKEHLTEISERADGLLQELSSAEPQSFTFRYDDFMKYLGEDGYGHKGHLSSGENENIELEVICYCENGRILEDSANAYQGEWTISPSFPTIGDTISDDSNKDWIIEGFYWDEEYAQPIPVLEGVEYSGQETIIIYAKMTPTEV